MNPKLCWRISNHDLSLTNPENSDRISLLQNELLIAQLCDGSRNVTTIIETYEAQSGETMPMEDLLAFLDQLSDKGALATRIAPPTGANLPMSRRGFLVSGVLSAAGVTAGSIGAAYAQSSKPDDGAPSEQESKAQGGSGGTVEAPEPSALAVLGAGLAGLGIFKWYQARHTAQDEKDSI